MTIKEVEEKTGLSRSNIRFYEKEKLIVPNRNDTNRYREYTEENVSDIKKIAYLRTLGISIQNIQKIINHEIILRDIICEQEKILDGQISDLQRAKKICAQMMEDEEINYDTLDIERYTKRLPEYWKENLLIGIVMYPYLPEQIPVQYSGGEVSSLVPKLCIFLYTVACIIIRILFRGYFRWKLQSQTYINNMISDYMTNCLCFVALSAEVFSILFLYGYVKNVVLMLAVDAIVLGGAFICGIYKIYANPSPRGNE